MKQTGTRLLAVSALALSASLFIGPASAQSFVNEIVLPGNSADLTPGSGANVNRLGGIFSDLFYDRWHNVYYGLSDRGPGGGLIAYETRLHKFSLDVNPTTGAISNFTQLETIRFTRNGQTFNGLNPNLLNGDVSVLGQSHDPEGLVVAPSGNFFVADEYGPSVYEFKGNGEFVRAFTPPDNIVPKNGSNLDFFNGRGTLTTGRQDNRGYEGLAVTPDGSKLFAIMQDPLVNEGSSNDGRRSRNLRIVEFDTATGQSTAQYIYQLESRDDINARIPGTSDDFGATAQGRNIGVSAIIAINDKEFLVIERDNRGIGVEDPDGSNPVGTKRIYKINLTGATDVSGISLAGTNDLPGGVTPVSKSLFLDIQAALEAAGLPIVEKLEGLAIGPKLADGSYALLLGSDNDYSVTQTGAGEQFDVYLDGTQLSLDSPNTTGSSLIPTYLYSFKGEVAGFAPQQVPEPGSVALLLGAGLVGAGFLRRRRK